MVNCYGLQELGATREGSRSAKSDVEGKLGRSKNGDG